MSKFTSIPMTGIAVILLALAACGNASEEEVATATSATVATTTIQSTSTTVAPTSTTPVPTTSTTSTTTTVAPSTTTAPLPECDWFAAHPSPPAEIGSISIPKIAVDQPIFAGVEPVNELVNGPGYCIGSALPGQPGDMLLFGHRTSHSKPFYDLDLLVVDDEINISSFGQVFTYKVTGTEILDDEDVDGLLEGQTATPRVKLIACHPKESSAQRIVVTAVLVSSSDI